MLGKRGREGGGGGAPAGLMSLGPQSVAGVLDLADGEETKLQCGARLFLESWDAGEGTAYVTTQ